MTQQSRLNAGFNIKAESECTAEPLPWTSNDSIAYQSPDVLDSLELSTSDEEIPSPPVAEWVRFPNCCNQARYLT